MIRRRSAGAPERAFRVAFAHVEQARDSLVAAMPSARYPGAPLADAILAFDAALGEARGAMEDWRTPATEEAWATCMRALEEVSRMTERFRLRAPQLDFEGLAIVLGDLIAPLDAFDDAEVAVRRAGRRD